VLRGKAPHVLIDPGHIYNELGEPCHDSLGQAMEKDGLRMEDVGLVILTHTHPDHFEASGEVVKKSGALLTLSREEEKYYSSTATEFYGMYGRKPVELSPSFYLKEGELKLGKDGLAIRILLTPGHSPGSISLYLPQEKILISGDVVFFASVGRTDLPGGSSLLLRKSIDQLSQLDVECLVPGHSTEVGNIIMGREKVKHNFHMVKLFV
jgi:glyoxylase-like metal-dependent hydrolase (beta-lactamase superfamily II)